MRGACRNDLQSGDYLVTGDGATGDRTRLSAVIASGESSSTITWALALVSDLVRGSRAQGVALTGPDGLLKALKRACLKRCSMRR